MARLSDGGTGSRIRVYPAERATTFVPWSATTYPRPDERLDITAGREMAPTTERLFWKDSGILAYRAGLDHPVDEEGRLVTWDELMAPPPPPKRGPGRPRKDPNNPKWVNQ